MGEKFYLTTAITYASRKHQKGNTYEIILTDAIARFKRMQGFDVHFCTGTDEHGQKVEDLAKNEGLKPQQYVDRVSSEIKRIWDLMESSYDTFIRTTDKHHVKTVQKIFNKLYNQGDIYKDKYKGWYCVPCESFWTDNQLVDGKCPECGREVKKTEEDAYFFRMSKYQDRLMEHIKNNRDFIVPKSRENEMINNFLKPGLQDLCVSRTSFKWGIPVDFDSKHVVYVWIDALANYITAIGYDPDNPSEEFKKLWPADLHVIGKDILRFHTIYWPIMLMALGLPLPKKIFGHPWLLSGESKMSKSIGNVIYADELSEMFSVDAVRFYLLSNMPYAQDGSITYENIIATWNSELANTLGNLVKRTGDMIYKYFDGVAPNPGSEQELDKNLKDFAMSAFTKYIDLMDSFKTADAIDCIMAVARRCNKYIDETTPWLLIKDESKHEMLATVLYNLLEGIRFISVMLLPIMPTTADEILNQIGNPTKTFESLKSFGNIKSGIKIKKPKVLFSRLDEEKKLKEIENAISVKNEKIKPENVITIDKFSNVELKVYEVIYCEKIEKSKKLLKLQLDGGNEKRQVVSGISAWYEPEELVGKKVIVVSNLKPVKLCGELSQGMILSADISEDDVKVIFVDTSVPNGTKLR
ncbi:MAG: methionine--tRNA ligase [Oscillospiraceae bacterium]|nr:methionine--tRNA ligase [Oscillospiraceae bacterium]